MTRPQDTLAERPSPGRLFIFSVVGAVGAGGVVAVDHVASRVLGVDLSSIGPHGIPLSSVAVGAIAWLAGREAASRLGVPLGRIHTATAAVTSIATWGVAWYVQYRWDLAAGGLTTSDTSFWDYLAYMTRKSSVVGGYRDHRIDASTTRILELTKLVGFVIGAVITSWTGHAHCPACGARGGARRWTLAWLPADPAPGEGALSKAAMAQARTLRDEAASGELREWVVLPSQPSKSRARVQLELSVLACRGCGTGALWLHAHEGGPPRFIDEVPNMTATFRPRALAAIRRRRP